MGYLQKHSRQFTMKAVFLFWKESVSQKRPAAGGESCVAGFSFELTGKQTDWCGGCEARDSVRQDFYGLQEW